MRVLIVGCGYVGVPLGHDLAGAGHEVFGLRRGASGAAAEALRAAGVHPLSADLTRPEQLEPLDSRFDWVVNCVASAGGTAEDYRRVYLEGTRNLLAWLKPAGLQKYVYTSSTGVYGQTEGETVDEASPTAASSATAQALLETERTLLEAARTRGFPAVILRLAGIYGPGRGYWLRQFLAGEARLDGAGERVLNMIHRDDVVGAVRAALEQGRPGDIYNVTDDEPVTQRDLFAWLAETLGRPLPPAAEAAGVGGRRGQTSKRVLNGRLRADLGYTLRYPTFREGFRAELRSRV